MWTCRRRAWRVLSSVARLEQRGEAPPTGPALLQVSVDGAMVPLRGKGEWAEVKTLAVGAVAARVNGPARCEGKWSREGAWTQMDVKSTEFGTRGYNARQLRVYPAHHRRLHRFRASLRVNVESAVRGSNNGA